MSSYKTTSSESTADKTDSMMQLAIAAPVIVGLFSNTFANAIDSSLALNVWKYSHYVNIGASVLSLLALVFSPPSFLKGSQALRYGQLTGFGFLSIAVQSYLCASGLNADASFLTEHAVTTTATVIIYNVAFFTLTWPMRIAENSPAINAAEKFFTALAIILSVGMVPALCLK